MFRRALLGFSPGLLAALISVYGHPAHADEAAWRALPFSAIHWQQRAGDGRFAVSASTLRIERAAGPASFCTKQRFGDFEFEFDVQAEAVDVAVLIRANQTGGHVSLVGHSTPIPVGGGWSRVRVTAHQDQIAVAINNATHVNARAPAATAGVVCLQVQPQVGGAGRAQWRNPRVKEVGRRGWVTLWNGKTLEGLAPLRGQWVVKDGLLIGSPAAGKHWGALRADMFVDDVVAKLVYRLKQANGGLYARARPDAEGAIGLVGLQVDLDSDRARNGALFETGGRGFIAKPDGADAPAAGDVWNEVIMSSHGGQVVSLVNGRQVASLDAASGGLQGVPAVEVFGDDSAGIEIKEFSVMGPLVPPRVDGVALGLCTSLKGESLAQARDAGFDYAEIGATEVATMTDDEFAVALAKVQVLSFPVTSAIVFLPGDMKVVGPDAKPDVQDAYLDLVLPRLSKLGLRMVVFGSGRSRRLPDGFSKTEGIAQLVDFGRRAATRARKQGMQIVVESLRSEETNMINTAAEALALVKAVNHPNFKMLVDYYHMALMKEDFAVIVKAGKSNIVHAQMANPTDRLYPTSDDESDYATFFERLRQIGYQGGVSIEARANNAAWDANRALRYLRRATAVLKKSATK